MPQECKEMKKFVALLVPPKGKSAETNKKVVKILEKKQNNKIITKFKVKTASGGLYTMVMTDRERAIKLEKAIPANVVAEHVGRLRSGKSKGSKSK